MELWFSESHTPNAKFSIRVDKQIYSGHSEFQRIDVFESQEFGRFLALDGYLMCTERTRFIYHEMITHVPMAVHKNARKILVIGGETEALCGSLCVTTGWRPFIWWKSTPKWCRFAKTICPLPPGGWMTPG